MAGFGATYQLSQQKLRPVIYAGASWGSRRGFSQEVFGLGEDLFDRVQVGGVFRQEEELAAGGADEGPHSLAPVAARLSIMTMSP